MTVSDPVADMLNRIRNALMMHHDTVILPASRIKLAIARVLKEEGFVSDFQVIRGKVDKEIKISLRYLDKNRPVITGLERVSKLGLRVYVQRDEIPRVYGGLGIAIVSTPKGVMTGTAAYRQGTGGELICYVW
jgi:small subunit ribosomal protein S8